jgi:hypothetical protein
MLRLVSQLTGWLHLRFFKIIGEFFRIKNMREFVFTTLFDEKHQTFKEYVYKSEDHGKWFGANDPPVSEKKLPAIGPNEEQKVELEYLRARFRFIENTRYDFF